MKQNYEIKSDRIRERFLAYKNEHPERLKNRLRVDAFAPENFTSPEPAEEEDNSVLRVKTFRMKPMTPEDAILQMNLLGHNFFVFRDSKSEEICVVYRRNDGAYGLIVPEE